MVNPNRVGSYPTSYRGGSAAGYQSSDPGGRYQPRPGALPGRPRPNIRPVPNPNAWLEKKLGRNLARNIALGIRLGRRLNLWLNVAETVYGIVTRLRPNGEFTIGTANGWIQILNCSRPINLGPSNIAHSCAFLVTSPEPTIGVAGVPGSWQVYYYQEVPLGWRVAEAWGKGQPTSSPLPEMVPTTVPTPVPTPLPQPLTQPLPDQPFTPYPDKFPSRQPGRQPQSQPSRQPANAAYGWPQGKLSFYTHPSQSAATASVASVSTITPGGLRQSVQQYRPARPNKNTKEKKFVFSIAGTVLGRVVGVTTETVDFITAIHDAMPYEFRAPNRGRNWRGNPVRPTPQAMLEAIWTHWDDLPDEYVAAALQNLVVEQFKDTAYGLLGRAGAKAGNRLGISGGLQVGPAL